MAVVSVLKGKGKQPSSLEVQEQMYKRRLEELKWHKGLSTQEILDRVNDPRTFRRIRQR